MGKATRDAALRKRKPGLSEAHKEALAEGREVGRAVKVYLEAIAEKRPKRGRPVADHAAALARIDAKLVGANVMERLVLTQRRLDLVAASAAPQPVDLAELEAGFVKVAAAYSSRRGVSRRAWAFVGVPKAVLDRAGVA